MSDMLPDTITQLKHPRVFGAFGGGERRTVAVICTHEGMALGGQWYAGERGPVCGVLPWPTTMTDGNLPNVPGRAGSNPFA